MARNALTTIALTLTLATGAARAQTPHTTSQQGDQSVEASAVADTLRAMYAAAQKDDLDAFHAVVTSGFYAFDNGQRFDGDALMRMVIDLHGKGAKAVWTVTKPNVHISGNEAWITYTNVGSLQMSPASPVVPVQWLESACLVKQEGRWKIAFFHSTRVPQ
jgi:ketosteroid isomerase-like protein